jgi:hypothetical protein
MIATWVDIMLWLDEHECDECVDVELYTELRMLVQEMLSEPDR